MTLTPGTRLGPYEITAQIGVGGMGEVYRATDTALGRDVAIKVLPSEFAEDADRLARFEREARTLASLNHPNIATIHGLERAGAVHALVLELVDGPTLADRIAAGPIPIDQAVRIARQIAEALEAAHERGIVHRDLKPANIKLRRDGAVKVLDFGLAKTVASGTKPHVPEATTITAPAMTEAGVILGTAPYMSPEQAQGSSVDRRSDIWAFGCVLYEMLTGRRAFSGASMTETLAAILEREVDWARLPPATPASVRTLLRRALEKDPKRRLHDIADARLELDDSVMVSAPAPVANGRRTTLLLTTAFGAVAVAAGLAGWFLRFAPASTAVTVARVVVAPENPLSAEAEGVVAVSPDGQHIAYVARGSRELQVRDLDRFEDRSLPGTEGADSPVFSPDGRWLAFFADRKVKKIALAGGSPVTLCEFAEGLGLSWESNDALLFNPGRATGIWRVSAAGGMPTAVTTLRAGETQHQHPVMLPGGKALLFTSVSGSSVLQVVVQSLETGQQHEIGRGAGGRYLPSGHVVYAQGGTLLAARFDPARLEVTGRPVVVLEGIKQTQVGTPQVATSESGVLAYVAASGQAPEDGYSLVWVDRAGREQPTAVVTAPFQMPRLAPDGRRVAVAIGAGASMQGNIGDLWIYDLARETRSRLTFDGVSTFPLWASGSGRFAYSSGQTGEYQIQLKALSGTVPDERLTSDRGTNYPLSWSADGQFLATVSVDPITANDIWVLAVANRPSWRPFVQTRFREGAPTFSPDGRWIAYASEQSGRIEIYMRPFPGPGEEWTISTGGGTEPLWAKNSGQLFYRQGDAMLVVDITTTPQVTVSKPRKLFEKPYNRSNGFWPNYDVTADGQRLLMVKGVDQEAPTRINLVLNWTEELKRLAPAP